MYCVSAWIATVWLICLIIFNAGQAEQADDGQGHSYLFYIKH